jgi:hypothetical protein
VSITVLPIATAVLAGVLAARIAGSAMRRFAPQKAFWSVGLLLYGIAAGAEAYGSGLAWTPNWFRVYYLAGGCLTVAFLGTGSAWLGLPRTWAAFTSGALAVTIVGALVTIVLADVDPAIIATTMPGHPPPSEAIAGTATVWAVACNSVGTVLLVGVSMASLLRRRRVRANVAILAGVALVGGAETVARFGSYGLVYAAQMLGIVLLAVGFELGSVRLRRPQTASVRHRIDLGAAIFGPRRQS